MENEKIKMVMMNEELFKKYADAACKKVIDEMHETAEKKRANNEPIGGII